MTYSTIAVVYILPIILFLSSGWDAALFLLYYLLGITGFIIVLKILSAYLPDLWVFTIIGICFIIAMHLIVHSWLFTGILTILVAFVLFVYFKFQNKVFTYIFVGSIIALVIYAMEFDGFHEVPHIPETALQQSEKEMSRYEEITEVTVGLEEDMVFCNMEVNQSMSEKEKQAFGETCAETISSIVGEVQQIKGLSDGYLGELYDDYRLDISVKEEGSDAFLQGSKGVHSGEIGWYLYE